MVIFYSQSDHITCFFFYRGKGRCLRTGWRISWNRLQIYFRYISLILLRRVLGLSPNLASPTSFCFTEQLLPYAFRLPIYRCIKRSYHSHWKVYRCQRHYFVWHHNIFHAFEFHFSELKNSVHGKRAPFIVNSINQKNSQQIKISFSLSSVQVGKLITDSKHWMFDAVMG